MKDLSKRVCAPHSGTILSRCADGASYRQIGREIGVSYHAVANWAKQHGFQRPKWRDTPRHGPSHGRWKGGRVVDQDGYVLLWTPEHPNCDRHGYVREHRLVMEQTLGRLLDRKEVVHHLDKNRSNNLPSNLEVFRSNAEHLRHELTGVPCPARGRRRISNLAVKASDGAPS